jgi:hypothetical protein
LRQDRFKSFLLSEADYARYFWANRILGMTYFIYARDGTGQIILKRESEEAALKKAHELKEMGWFDVEVRQEKKPAAA